MYVGTSSKRRATHMPSLDTWCLHCALLSSCCVQVHDEFARFHHMPQHDSTQQPQQPANPNKLWGAGGNEGRTAREPARFQYTKRDSQAVDPAAANLSTVVRAFGVHVSWPVFV